MNRLATAAIALSLAASPALAQKLTTQPRSGLGDAGHATNPSNASPAGSMNAQTGPQSRPAYPSGSDTPNPGEAMVRSTTPKPASGTVAQSPGTITGTTNGAGTGGPPVGQAATPPR